ncbi:MAG: DNA polymerase III subunit gamma/tau [Endozoicomonadaceae bacterium]|nr:DNA polymerase III subunit gamma/tau [Endozoicomonadaceae bacterium]
MSYQVLARKWRPRIFKELVGQVNVLQALINALDRGRLHHAYLFTGTRGVGKTTIARILAKCLNCETGVTSEPCGECSACREIDEGRFIDLIEVDAASRTKVEDTRELLDNVQYAPTRGRFKIYLIDEVHMLSQHSFNALLKTLEEPPLHVKFLLATTDPQKLPITILSRCLQFSLKSMSPEKIVGHLQEILDKEGIRCENGALWQLGRSADGSMRDALSLTDQAIAFCDESITEQGVSTMLGSIDRDQVLKVVSALASADASKVLNTVAGLAEHAPDFASVLSDTLSILHRVAIAQALPDVVDNSQGDRDAVLSLARQMTAEDLQLYYQSGLIGRRDLPLAPDPRSGFEMVLLRMLAFRPDGIIPSVPVQPLPQGSTERGGTDSNTAPQSQGQDERKESESVNRAVDVKSTSVPTESVRVVPMAPVVTDVAAFNALVAESTDQASAEHDYLVVQSSEPMVVTQPEVLVRQAPSEVSVPEATTAERVDKTTVSPPERNEEKPFSNEPLSLSELTPVTWIALFQALSLDGVTRTVASYCLPEFVEGSCLTMVLDSNHDTLYNEKHRLRIEASLSDYFDMKISLVVSLGEVSGETPAAWRYRCQKERQQRAVDGIHSDENVKMLISTFSGTLLDQSIEAVD